MNQTFDKDYLISRMNINNNGCWLWNRSVDGKGYGLFKIEGRTVKAHRFSYQLYKGRIGNKQVCHTCDVRNCINPEHLWLGTNLENSLDMVSKGRSAGQKKTACVQGHPLSGSNLYVCPKGYRECKTCRRENVRRWRAK